MKRWLTSIVILTAACGDPGGSQNAEEAITTVILEFHPTFGAGGPPVIFEFDDPDGDGGDPPIVDDIDLDSGDYTLIVRFENRLEDPAEDITAEVEDESDQHLVLLTGSAVVGPATTNVSGPILHLEYDDLDANDLPVGLQHELEVSSGTGELVVTLRHMPPEEPPVKGADTLDIVRDEGIDAIGGSTDVSVTFNVTVL